MEGDDKFAKEHKEWELGGLGDDLFHGVNLTHALEPEEKFMEKNDQTNILPVRVSWVLEFLIQVSKISDSFA